METQLKTLYGRRTTPIVKIFMLIVAVLLGLHLVFSKASQGDKTHTPVTTSIDVRHNHQAS